MEALAGCVARHMALLAALAAVAAGGFLAAAADAARRPSDGERKAIKRVALRACEAPGGCRYQWARVSTRNPRFAWAQVVGEGFSGVLLKRPRPKSKRFRVVGVQGGGIGDCAEWRRLAPRRVLRDLRIHGLLDADGTVGRCG